MNVLQQYSTTDISSLDQVELESRALVRTACTLNAIKENWDERSKDLEDALEKNRKLWTILASEVHEESCPQPIEVRNNIMNLALFIFKKTVSIMVDPTPESLKVLIDINMNIAKGLSEHPEECVCDSSEA